MEARRNFLLLPSGISESTASTVGNSIFSFVTAEHSIRPEHVPAQPPERDVQQVSDVELLREVAPVADDAGPLADVEAGPEHRLQDAERSLADHAVQHEQVETEAGPRGPQELPALPGVRHTGVLLP